MKIFPVPCLEDNYAYLVIDEDTIPIINGMNNWILIGITNLAYGYLILYPKYSFAKSTVRYTTTLSEFHVNINAHSFPGGRFH